MGTNYLSLNRDEMRIIKEYQKINIKELKYGNKNY